MSDQSTVPKGMVVSFQSVPVSDGVIERGQ